MQYAGCNTYPVLLNLTIIQYLPYIKTGGGGETFYQLYYTAVSLIIWYLVYMPVDPGSSVGTS